MNFSTQIMNFLNGLDQNPDLPDNIRVMNPFHERPLIKDLVFSFYSKFYNDENPRHVIIGINPGRLGAGTTGVPFTDTKRMQEICGISVHDIHTYEPSSVFVYKLIDLMGGPFSFYGLFYISSVSPLGFLHQNNLGKWINCNYYDYKSLEAAVMPFIEQTLKTQATFPIKREICFVLGKKNADHFYPINKRLSLFKEIKVLDHPRFIMQYKTKEMDVYLKQYLDVLSGVC